MAQHLNLQKEDLRRVRGDLANAGTGLLFLGLVSSVGALLFLVSSRYRPCSGYGYALGGLLSLLLVLRRPLNPVRVGHRFTRWPDKLSPYELALLQLIYELRSRWIIILSGTFLILIGFLYGGGSLPPSHLSRCITDGSILVLFLSGLGCIVGFVGGFDFLYVWWKLRKEGRAP